MNGRKGWSGSKRLAAVLTTGQRLDSRGVPSVPLVWRATAASRSGGDGLFGDSVVKIEEKEITWVGPRGTCRAEGPENAGDGLFGDSVVKRRKR
jgi:hypothetical protein